MLRLLTAGSALCWLLALPVPALVAQGTPYAGQPYDPYARPGETATDPKARRAQRERAVAFVGAAAREFVEAHGDDAVAAIASCSKEVALKLAEFYTAGELNKLPRPRDLLRVIAQHRPGDDIVLWAMQHARELTDADNFEAYLLNPLEYALNLKSLADGAAETRVRRLSGHAAGKPPATPLAAAADDWKGLLWVLAVVLVGCGLITWWRRPRPVV